MLGILIAARKRRRSCAAASVQEPTTGGGGGRPTGQEEGGEDSKRRRRPASEGAARSSVTTRREKQLQLVVVAGVYPDTTRLSGWLAASPVVVATAELDRQRIICWGTHAGARRRCCVSLLVSVVLISPLSARSQSWPPADSHRHRPPPAVVKGRATGPAAGTDAQVAQLMVRHCAVPPQRT